MVLAFKITCFWYYIAPRRKAIAQKNLKIAFPQATAKEINRIVFWSSYNLALSLLEFSYFPHVRSRKLDQIVEIQGLDNIDKALGEKKGVLIMGTHMGNGDLAMFATSRKSYPMHLIYRPVKSNFLDKYLKGLRSLSGLNTLLPKGSSLKIVRSLKKNEIVVFVSDQFTYKPIGIKTEFFGKSTGTNSSLASFAIKLKCPVIPAFSYRRGKKLVVVYDQAIQTEEPLDTLEKNVTFMTDKYNGWIENIIKRHPEAWMWVHRRWKKM